MADFAAGHRLSTVPMPQSNEYSRATWKGKPLTLNDGTRHAFSLASFYADKFGLKVIDVSPAEAELYANTDLSGVDVEDWHQSYPMILVRHPVTSYPHVVAVVPMPQLGYPVNLLASNNGIVDHVHIGTDCEMALATSSLVKLLMPIEVGRIAINAVLHLANYPELYGSFPNRAHRIITRTGNVGTSPKRRELIPQIIRLREHDVSLFEATKSRSYHTNSPHWRRGHWRRVAIGVGRLDRKWRWFRPVLVNARHVAGGTAATTMFKAG